MSAAGAATEAPRCGYVALLGAPNVGKSSLLNALVGGKISIVSPKAQTTRSRILGIVMDGATQIILVDTPGIFEPKRRLDRAMVAAAWQGAGDADLIALLIDASHGLDRRSAAIADRLKGTGRPAVAVLNKIDIVAKSQLLALTAAVNATGAFKEIFMVSALTGDGVAAMRRGWAAAMPAGPYLFPPDQLSDMPLRLMAAEITREQLYRQLQQELPYDSTVETEQWQERPDGSARIEQSIVVARDGQKAIVVGKGGTRIKEIGRLARLEMQKSFDRPVHLFLHVKVREKWAEDRARYSDWGLDYDAK